MLKTKIPVAQAAFQKFKKGFIQYTVYIELIIPLNLFITYSNRMC